MARDFTAIDMAIQQVIGTKGTATFNVIASSMLSHKAKSAALALAAATAVREAGKGWANGNLPHMNKPLARPTGKA